MSTQIPRPASPIVIDPKTGEMSRIWFRFFEQNNQSIGSVSSLASGSIFIGDASNLPAAQAVTGAITLSASGVTAIANNAVTNAILNDMAAATVKGRAVGAGTGDPTDLTATQLVAIVATADGAGSGLDADTLDGLSSLAFIKADGTVALAGAWSMGSQATTNVNIDSGAIDGTPIGASSASTIVGTSSRATGGSVIPSAGTSQVQNWVTSSIPLVHLVNSTRSADSRAVSLNLVTGGMALSFHNDAFNVTLDAIAIVGSSSAITSVTIPNGTFIVTNTLTANGPVNLGDASGDTITVTGTPAGQVIGSTYSPTRSAEANLDANVTMGQAQYMRVGATVTVSGAFTADPTLPATATSFEFTLPVASNIGAVEDCAGVAFAGGIAGLGAAISGSVANNTAVVSWISSDTTSQAWSYNLTYQVI